MTEIATRPAAPPRTGALAGIRVVEVGFAAAGPLVGKYLANFGAEVIRLESRLAPDVFRTTYPPFKDGVVKPDGAAMFELQLAGHGARERNGSSRGARRWARALAQTIACGNLVAGIAGRCDRDSACLLGNSGSEQCDSTSSR